MFPFGFLFRRSRECLALEVDTSITGERVCLNEHWFTTMSHARQAIEKWWIEYNTEQPRSSLGDRKPEEYAKNGLARMTEAESSAADLSSRPY